MSEDHSLTVSPPKRRAGPIRVCVLDDHPLIHDGLRYLASQTQDIEFCGGATNGRELDALLRAVTPDILLLDVNLNGENCFALCRKAKDRYPALQVLVVSAFGDSHLLQRSIQAGASGYALKSVSMTELPAAIRQLADKGVLFFSDLVALCLERPRKTRRRSCGIGPSRQGNYSFHLPGVDKLRDRTRACDQRSYREIPRQPSAAATSVSATLGTRVADQGQRIFP